MHIERKSFGQTMDGQPVDAFILENSRGMTVKLINYGAAVVSINVPDRNGSMADVVLGFDDMAGYQGDKNPHMGCCCGRYANRIAGARFTLDGIEYTLAANNGPNSLHGGWVGFDKKVWDAEIIDDAVRMSLTSPDGEEGYPGTLQAAVTYRLNDENELRIDYMAETDAKTVINLTNHSYFNLAGGGSVRDHVIRIHADRYTVLDDTSIPTGEIRDVAGTEMDLRIPTPIGKNIDAVQGLGYDHNYCLNRTVASELVLAASVSDPVSGRTLECWTTEPGLQFYTANHLNGVQGKGGAFYNKQEGFCLETQHWPDSPNQPEFPSTELAPGETYTQTCIYQFGVKT
jgi:aldose 1-epimerase